MDDEHLPEGIVGTKHPPLEVKGDTTRAVYSYRPLVSVMAHQQNEYTPPASFPCTVYFETTKMVRVLARPTTTAAKAIMAKYIQPPPVMMAIYVRV